MWVNMQSWELVGGEQRGARSRSYRAWLRNFRNYGRHPSWACQRLESGEPAAVLAFNWRVRAAAHEVGVWYGATWDIRVGHYSHVGGSIAVLREVPRCGLRGWVYRWRRRPVVPYFVRVLLVRVWRLVQTMLAQLPLLFLQKRLLTRERAIFAVRHPPANSRSVDGLRLDWKPRSRRVKVVAMTVTKYTWRAVLHASKVLRTWAVMRRRFATVARMCVAWGARSCLRSVKRAAFTCVTVVIVVARPVRVHPAAYVGKATLIAVASIPKARALAAVGQAAVFWGRTAVGSCTTCHLPAPSPRAVKRPSRWYSLQALPTICILHHIPDTYVLTGTYLHPVLLCTRLLGSLLRT